LIYTILDTKDRLYYVPSIVMFTNVVMKNKKPEEIIRKTIRRTGGRNERR